MVGFLLLQGWVAKGELGLIEGWDFRSCAAVKRDRVEQTIKAIRMRGLKIRR